MTHALAHRGPDGEGYREEPGIALGHRRLAIIDLAHGQQPLSNEDGTIWLVCNGEIFNYVELRADLERRGHRFSTQSDSETIIHLYEERGLDFVDQMNGQFAFALWDQRRRRLVLARDRVGIRPLFHATLPDGSLLFGSEMKALLAHGGVRAAIDPAAVGQVATLWVTIPPRTAFKGIEELCPGAMLVLDGSRRSVRRYWRHDFPRQHEYEERDIDHWCGRVRELLDDAIRLQLRADVPIATYLSGGLDSSILTALAARRESRRMKSFSVAFSAAAFDEREHQNRMAAYLGTEHARIEVDDGVIGGDYASVVWFAERLLTRTAPAPLLRLAGLVRNAGIKVVLSGEGADELFGGYDIFREDKVRRFWAREPRSQRRPALFARLHPYVRRDRKADAFWRLFFRAELENTADPYYSHRVRWRNSSGLKRIFTPDVRAKMQSDEQLDAELDVYLDADRSEWHPLCRAQYLEMSLFMSGYLLNSQGDRMAMGHSVEQRVPFLDHRVIELAARIPPKFKIRSLQEKYILKRAFADLVPPAVLQRPKHPYRAPIAGCFSRERNNLPARLLERDAVERSGFIEPGAIDRMLCKGSAPSERDEMALALAASVQLMQHLFVTDFRPGGPRVTG